MKKIIFTSLLFCMTALSINAQFLFRVTKKNLSKPSYILGTIHTMPGSLLDSIPTYLAAEKECTQLYTECDISDKQHMDKVVSTGQDLVTLLDNKTIFDIMKKNQIELLDSRFKETFHINLTDSAVRTIWNYNPMVFISTFSLFFATEEMKKYPELELSGIPIDIECISRAKNRGMSIGQLDLIHHQDSIAKIQETLNSSIESKVDSLMAFLNNFEQYKQKIAEEIKTTAATIYYWKRGDYNSFAKSNFWLSQVESNPALFKQRNDRWVLIISKAIQHHPTLFVFGAAHLIGPNGIIQKIRDMGYVVEQI